MVAPNPLAARRRTNSSSLSGAVPSSWEASVVSGAIANRLAISRPQLNLKGDQTDHRSNLGYSPGGIEEGPFAATDKAPGRGCKQRISAVERGNAALVEDASGVDDDGLAGHGLGAAHGDHHVGAVVLVGGLLQERARCGALDLLGRRLAVARVPSSRPGATQLTSVSGASATAMQRVR